MEDHAPKPVKLAKYTTAELAALYAISTYKFNEWIKDLDVMKRYDEERYSEDEVKVIFESIGWPEEFAHVESKYKLDPMDSLRRREPEWYSFIMGMSDDIDTFDELLSQIPGWELKVKLTHYKDACEKVFVERKKNEPNKIVIHFLCDKANPVSIPFADEIRRIADDFTFSPSGFIEGKMLWSFSFNLYS